MHSFPTVDLLEVMNYSDTLPGIVIGQTILALPIIVSLTATAVEGMEKKLYFTLASFGLTTTQMIQSVVLGTSSCFGCRRCCCVW